MEEVLSKGVYETAVAAMAHIPRDQPGNRQADQNEVIALLNDLKGQLQDQASLMTKAQADKLREERKHEPPDARIAVCVCAPWPWLQILKKPVNEAFDMRTITTILRVATICDAEGGTEFSPRIVGQRA